MSDLTVSRRGGWTRITRRWTDTDGTRREEWTNVRDDGASYTAHVTMAPLTRWQRLACTRLGRHIPRPWSDWIRCHGTPTWDGCYWNQRVRDRLIEMTVCSWRGHDAVWLVEGVSVMCGRCRDDWHVDGTDPDSEEDRRG